MKNIFFKSTALVAVLTMTMSGCSNEELTGDNGQSEVKGISSITLETPQGGPSTRLEYNTDNITQALGVKWRAGKWTSVSSDCERALVVNAAYGMTYGLVLTRKDAGEATSKTEFNFVNPAQELSQQAYSGSIGLLYPYKSDYSAAFNITGSDNKNIIEATLPLNGQTGVLADMQNFDYMTTGATISSDVATDKDLNMTFKHRIAVMRLTGLIFPAGTASTATSIAISGTGLMTDAKLTFTKGANNTLTESLVLGSTQAAITTTGTFNITNNVLDDVYICFFPGNADATGTHQITGLKVTATVGSDTYEYNYGADAAVSNKVEKFVEGKMYTLKDKMMTKQASGIEWATGNLVADGPNGAKIGAPTDGGLYFQFGSLVGWSGGATGDGTGTAVNGSVQVVVKPSNLYSGNEDWAETGKIWLGTEGTVPFTVKDSGSDEENAGIGDPCRYYLGDPWRLPTNEEYVELFKNHGFPSTGPWKWENASATNNTKNLTFPASGYRRDRDGDLRGIETFGYYWSASPFNDSSGYYLDFNSSVVDPSGITNRALGLPVRCVQNASN